MVRCGLHFALLVFIVFIVTGDCHGSTLLLAHHQPESSPPLGFSAAAEDANSTSKEEEHHHRKYEWPVVTDTGRVVGFGDK